MLRSWVKSEKGAVLPLMGAAIFVLLMATGLAIDYTRALIVKERLQWALDAAALAGTKKAMGGQEAVQAQAQKYFEANFPSKYMSTSDGVTVNAIPIPAIESGGTAYRFTVTNVSMDTYIMNTVGIKDIGVGAAAEVNTLPLTPLDVVFSLDLSGSMQVLAGKPGSDCVFLNASGVYPDKCYSSNPDVNSKLADAKREIINLVNLLDSGTEDTRFGLVPWSSYVNPLKAIAGTFDTHSCFDGTKQTYLATENPVRTWEGNAETPPMQDASTCREFAPGTIKKAGALRPMIYLTTDIEKIINEVEAQKAEANTDGALGMFWSYEMLKGKNDKSWLNWRAPAVNKSIVLLTDGNNTKYYGTPSKADALTVGEASNEKQKQVCKAARDDGITIYTIAYDIKGEDQQRRNAKAMLKDCASNGCPTSDGKCFFDAQSAGDLAAAMQVIGKTMMTMRLTK